MMRANAEVTLMHIWRRCFLVLVGVLLLAACSDEPKKEYKEVDWDRLTKAVKDEPAIPKQTPESADIAPAVSEPDPGESQGGVTISLLPERPDAGSCMRAIVQGRPGRPVFQWFVNGEQVPEQIGSRLCGDFFRRGDQVTVQVGTSDVGASTSVTIGNALPRVVQVDATAQQAFSHGDITVTATGEDLDGDPVEFRYQWIINGEPDTFQTTATLPAAGYAKGDSIQFRITPYDGFDEGTPYESKVLEIGNAAPVITSKPPRQFEAAEYSYQVEAQDPDGTKLNFSLSDPPAGMTISADGLVTWPLSYVAPGTYKISIVVADSDGDTTTQEYTLTLSKTAQGTQN